MDACWSEVWCACLDVSSRRMASKKQKKTALLRPLEMVRGPKPRKKPRHPRFSASKLRTALMKVGRCEAEHIILVFTTSKGVVVAAAHAPALPPMIRSSKMVGCRSLCMRQYNVRAVSYTANLTAMSGASSSKVGINPVNRPRTPTALVMDEAAWNTFLYTPACTDRMHTAIGTLTKLLPTAAVAPEVNAMEPSDKAVVFRRHCLAVL
mmetsp:Transcript_3509/g.9420  ORF Transcript_3509/g.9420 Transcript_3509/m.9420 type:complete len:208 (-) Transcript_3509:649-1272(-)